MGKRLPLQAWRLGAIEIRFDLGRKGLKDEEIVVLLRRQRNVTFFTRDADFFEPSLRHSGYCIAVAGVGQNEVAAFIRRFLRHPSDCGAIQPCALCDKWITMGGMRV